MAESLIFSNIKVEELLKRYMLIVGEGEFSIDDDDIIEYEDNYFYDINSEWSVMEVNVGDTFAVEVILKMAKDDKMIYTYLNEDMLEGELIIVQKGEIIKQLFDYFSTPELNINIGYIDYEDENSLKGWIDIGTYSDYIYNKLQEE